ncbi:MAG TPA: hypothetical protein VGB71_08385 [Flavisolibacter sp.]
MKKLVLMSILFLFAFGNAEAQVKSTRKKAGTKKAVVKKTKPTRKDTATTTLSNTGGNAAYAPASGQRLSIADPTVNTLNLRAAGARVPEGTSPVMGMPKGTYGIANGKILLRNTTATSSGTSYGSGAVGTGTSISGVGTSETTIGVNGKSPYAGPWLWGDRRPVYNVPVGDSVRRQ